MKKFWEFRNQEQQQNGDRDLLIDGEIAAETWWGDEITPAAFRGELFAGSGHVTVWINSPGGDVFAASQIYTMMTEYRKKNGPDKVTVKIDGLAASAASVIAMGGSQVLMAPTAMLMIHNPATVAYGDHNEMEKAAAILDEVRESIINAYERKTGLSRARLTHMMEAETWMNAVRAVELGFCDGIIGDTDANGNPHAGTEDTARHHAFTFERKTTESAIVNKINESKNAHHTGRRVDELMDKLIKSR